VAEESKYDVVRTVGEVSRKTKITGKVIEAKRGSLGLSLLAKVDFLVNYHNYVLKFV